MGLFAIFSIRENRITATILEVLRSLSLSRIERILGALMEQSEFELVTFGNQYAEGGGGVPDAIILGSCRIFVETKTSPNKVDGDQLRRHLDKLNKAKEITRVLLVLTPDEQRPAAIQELKDERAIWASFSTFSDAIEDLLADEKEVISEREEYLLRELQTMFLEEGLIRSANDVLVVPARRAWPEYQAIHAYICQENRPFRNVERMAFYSLGQIHPRVPLILKKWDSIALERGKHSGWEGQLVDRLFDDGVRTEGAIKKRIEGAKQKVFQLSGPDDPQTIKLETAVINDLRSEDGRPVAFTQHQRYISLDKLKKAKTTKELVAD